MRNWVKRKQGKESPHLKWQRNQVIYAGAAWWGNTNAPMDIQRINERPTDGQISQKWKKNSLKAKQKEEQEATQHKKKNSHPNKFNL